MNTNYTNRDGQASMHGNCPSPVADDTALKISAIGDAVVFRAKAILQASPYPEVRTLNCEEADGTLRVSGQVSRFYLKQHALTLAKKVPGVYRVVDEVSVRDSASPSDPSGALRRRHAVVPLASA